MDDAEYVALMGAPPPAPIPPKRPLGAAFADAVRNANETPRTATVMFSDLDANARPTGEWRSMSSHHAAVDGFVITIEPPRPPAVRADPDLDALLLEGEYIERATRTTSRGLFGR